MSEVKQLFTDYIHALQDAICHALENIDGRATFREDKWDRPEGGGGKTRVIANGGIFEKGGVNTSIVHGKLPPVMQQSFGLPESNFFACGLSLVIHPHNPYVPTVHANWRYFELYDTSGKKIDCWFGGGADLTPYYLFKDDCAHFHTALKEATDAIDLSIYPKHKQHCDEYFINKHRDNEARGIGGVFYDYLRPDSERDENWHFNFQVANGNAFLPAYLPIVQRRMHLEYGEREKEWQEIRRGRYAEFNLVHDRGTLFGLKTNGRTESILMSLPPRARWYYDYHPEPGTPEAELVQHLLPQDWVSM